MPTMIRRLLVLLLLLLPVPAAAQSLTGELAGSWALRFDGSVIFRFDIERDGEGWRGAWSRPANFSTDGDRFANLAGGTVTIPSRDGRDFAGWAELTFPDDRPGAVPDIFRFRVLPTGRAEMIYAETGLAPYVLDRVAAHEALGPFEPGKVYSRPGTAPAPLARPAPPAPPAPEPAETPRRPAFEGR
jgi:hypothetical protein